MSGIQPPRAPGAHFRERQALARQSGQRPLGAVELEAYRSLQILLLQEARYARGGMPDGPTLKAKRARRIADARAVLDEVMLGDV